ncbi:antibiotic biosynthesis monooxygenase [Streptomyces sp. UH6]|uniref:antibiotic biosynthesis monooxygenase family protein n=1 Tax=Streptomyces sp. UH6 TaxID=2748379 RepID=UPI0015D4A1A2|nr:antibiotic biosynthesis monooxygenase [Streptomyces sp. UH6]NYV74555.1 antibiotic biosynthesis monooxygenase [Streptomyces sp. UH6]
MTDERFTTDDGITLIDVWELPEERIDEAIARWKERVALIHTAPGFRDARLHRGLDPEAARFGLVNVAHWDSVEARDKALTHPGFTASAATTTGYAVVHGGWYRVAAAFGAQGDGSGVTVVEAFELPAERLDGFLPQWSDRVELTSEAPGFQHARLHRAVAPDTRFQAVGVAHWDSPEAWRTATAAGGPPILEHPSAPPGFTATGPLLLRSVAAY